MSAKSPLTQTNVGKSVRADLDGLGVAEVAFAACFCPCWTSVETPRAFVTTTKVAAGKDCRSIRWRAVIGRVNPARVMDGSLERFR